MNSLNDAQAGEQVIRIDGHRQSVATIARVTPTQILIPGATEGTFLRFNRHDGRSIGFDCGRLEAGTPSRLHQFNQEQRRADLAEQLQRRNWSSVPLEKLEEINAILTAANTTPLPEAKSDKSHIRA